MNITYGNPIGLKEPVNELILPVYAGNNNPIIYCVLDQKSIIFANDDFISTFVIHASNLPSMNFIQLIHPEHAAIFSSTVSELELNKTVQLQIKLIDLTKKEIQAKLFISKFIFGKELISILAYDINKYENTKTELRVTRERFYYMIEDMTEIVEMETADNTLIYANDAYCRYFGKTRDKLLGASGNDLIYEEDLPIVLDILNNQLTPENPCTNIEARVIQGNGEIGSMSWMVRGFFDENGSLTGHQSVGRDITELKRYQEQLKLSEGRYRGIVEDQTELIVRLTLDNILLFANDAYCRFFGYDLDDVLGKQVVRTGSYYQQTYFKTITPDNPVTVYNEKVAASESDIVWIEWTARGFFNEYGELIEIQKVGRNITDRKNAEEALQRNKDELAIRVQERTAELSKANQDLTILNNNMQNIFKNMPSGVIVADETGKVTSLNNYLKQFWGDVTEEIYDILSNHIINRKNPHLNRLFYNNESFQDVEFTFPTSREDHHCLMSGIYYENHGERLKSGVIIIRPIKEIHNLVNRFSGASARFSFTDIASANDKMQMAIKNARQAAAGISNILITGESGTGKEMFAQSIHNQSLRSKGPFVAVNCGAIPRDLLGSELFGYSEGAFTGAKKGGNPGKFELASGGTIFLDEIGDMPIDQQVALLRVIQEKSFTRIGGNKVTPIDVRIICATNRNLLREIEKGNFRQDLYYRLNVIHIKIPPLRERPEDILMLFKYFLVKSDMRWQYDFERIDSEIMSHLSKYHWPGNVRELQNIVERMLQQADGSILSVKHLPEDIFSIPASITESIIPEEEEDLTIRQIHKLDKKRLEEEECKEILRLLKCYRGNISKVARELGVARSTIYYKMEKYQIDN